MKTLTTLLLSLLVLGGCASTAEYLKKVEANVERMNEENLIKDAAKGCNILPSQVRELSDEDKKFCRQQLWDRESEQRQNKVNTIKPIETGTGGIAGFLQSEEVSGNGKICYYNVNGTTKAMNVNRWATCRSVERF